MKLSRPIEDYKMSKNLNIRISAVVMDRLEEICEMMGYTKSDAVRYAINMYHKSCQDYMKGQ